MNKGALNVVMLFTASLVAIIVIAYSASDLELTTRRGPILYENDPTDFMIRVGLLLVLPVFSLLASIFLGVTTFSGRDSWINRKIRKINSDRRLTKKEAEEWNSQQSAQKPTRKQRARFSTALVLN